MSPFEVQVTIGGKSQSKGFSLRADFEAFLKKAEEMKSKAPSLEVKIVREQPYDPREDSIAFEPMFREDGSPYTDAWGKQSFRCVRVPTKKGHMFCTHCHSYKVFKSGEYGKECDCGMTDRDAYIKTANGLW